MSNPPTEETSPDLAANDPAADPLRSVHTASFPELLAQLGASVLVTTYQAGKLVVLRNDGGVLNTHFRNLPKPMGLARDGGRLAIGCHADVWEFHNVPAVCGQLDESDDYPQAATSKHDACFLPRRSHCTGDIQIHEMAFARAEARKAQAEHLQTEPVADAHYVRHPRLPGH